MTQGPDERIEFLSRLRDRLAATNLRLREAARNVATNPTEAERERNRIQDALAEINTVLQALSPEVRGRVSYNPAEVMDATTERGQRNAITRLIDRALDALEEHLKTQYDEAFETLLDLAKPDLRQNKSIRGRLTPETQRLVNRVLEITTLSPADHAAQLAAADAKIIALEDQELDPADPDSFENNQAALEAARIDFSLLNTFGNYSLQTASEKAAAYQELRNLYTRGRTARTILDQHRRQEIKDATNEVLATLPKVDQAKHATRTADQGFSDTAAAWTLGMSSFHQVMEWLFPNSTTARDLQEKVRAADRAVTRARIHARERFDSFTYGVWSLTGPARFRKRNAILAKLSEHRTWNIQLREGVTFQEEKLTEDQASAILAGTIKTGWENDPIARNSLAQALADFRMQRLKAQNEARAFRSTVIRFRRLTSRGTPGAYVASDLQALYLLQLHAQEQYRPALDRYGFTADVMAAIERQINPKALDLGDHLRAEYDAEWSRLNPVYQRIYGLDLPRIRNYAPGSFEHQDAKSGSDSTISADGSPHSVNAMAAGFTKARAHHMARPKDHNALASYWSHLEATEYFIHYAEVCRDARAIFRSPLIRRAVEGNHGTKAARLLGQWLDALEVDGNFRAEEMQAIAEATSRAIATQAAVGLAYNLGSAVKQIPAVLNALLEMPAKEAVSGFWHAFTRPQDFAHVWNSEAVQQRILAGFSPEARRLLDASSASPSLIIDALRLGILHIAWADAAFTTISATAAYSHHHAAALKAGLSPSEAEKSALAAMSRVIERTAQPATTQDKSMAELTARGMTRYLFLFRSDPRQKLALAANAIHDVIAGKPGSKTKLAKIAFRKAILGWVLYGLANEAVSDIFAAITRDDDDPDRWSWRDYLAAILVGPSSGLPIIGTGWETLVRASIGTRAYGNSEGIADQTLRAAGASQKIWKELSDDAPSDWTVNEWLTKSQQLAASAALAAGAFDPRAAIIPAALRLTRDAQGAAANLIPETAQQKQHRIIAEVRAEGKPARDTKSAETKKLARELATLDPAAQAARLSRLDPETRRAVLAKLSLSRMTAAEQALHALPKDQRAEAIRRISATMDPSATTAWQSRLQSLHLAD